MRYHRIQRSDAARGPAAFSKPLTGRSFYLTSCLFLCAIFTSLSCSSVRDKETPGMHPMATLTVGKIEKGASGNMVLFGTVSNQGKSAASIPWLGEPGAEAGAVTTSLGTLEIQEGQGWKMISGFKDGTRPLETLDAGQSVRFCFPTTAPFPDEHEKYRFTMPTMRPVEFTLR